MDPDENPTCPYCREPAMLVTGEHLYKHRADLASKKFWVCDPCGARVGCHGKGANPLGRLANAELRRWKTLAHAKFDPHWKSGKMGRTAAYKRLAECLSERFVPRSSRCTLR